MRRPTARGAASDNGPLCGGPDGFPRGSTVSQVAGCSGVRGNLISNQSAMCECLHVSVRREAALNGVNKVTTLTVMRRRLYKLNSAVPIVTRLESRKYLELVEKYRSCAGGCTSPGRRSFSRSRPASENSRARLRGSWRAFPGR